MSQTVYVVTAGYYSDYSVVAVFSDKAIADVVATKMEEGDVMSFVLDEYEEQARQGLNVYRVSMKKNGDTERVDLYGIDYASRVGDLSITTNVTTNLVIFVWARDEQHAVKIVNEKRTQLIATGEWERMAEKTGRG